ncbi:MAG: hypothetical protein ACYCZF_06555 [Anaerolineae bacterium]
MRQFFLTYSGRALIVGLVITVIEIASSIVRWLLQRVLDRHPNSPLAHWRLHPESQLVSQYLQLIWSLGAPFLALYLGIFSTQDIGIPLPDWQLVLPWIAVTLGTSLLWIGWLWGRHWVRHPEERPRLRGSGQPFSLTGLVTHLFSQEGYLASTRAALRPLLGSYWGVWAGIAVKIGISLLEPQVRKRLKTIGQRDSVLLDWAADLVTGALFVLTGSIIVTGICRFIILITMWLLARWLPARRSTASE